MNILETDFLACEFRLDNYVDPSFAEQVTNSIEGEYDINVSLYGELGARCIVQNIVLPGVDFMVVTTIYGQWEDIVMKNVNKDRTEIALLIYHDRFIVFENAKVVFVKEYEKR